MGEYVKVEGVTGGVPAPEKPGQVNWEERQGNSLYDVEGNLNLDPKLQIEREEVNAYLTGIGMDPGRMNVTEDNMRLYKQYSERVSQGDYDDIYNDFESDAYEYTRWAGTDMAVGLWNRGVAGMAGAILSLPATIGAAATGGANDTLDSFWDAWEVGVEDMEKGMSFTGSDKSTIPLTQEINAHNLGFAVGDGIGFVADIFLGSHGVGALAKLSKGASHVQKMQRLGSFLTGTAQMQKDLYREGRDMGLSVGHSARVALPVASVVSLSEGAALEMVGQIISNPVSRSLGRQAYRAELKAMGKNLGEITPAAFQKLATGTTKSFGLKMKGIGQKAFQGSVVEAVQEGTQTYIEEFGKVVSDMYFAPKGATKGKGKFGADMESYETFKKAMVGALVGGIVGGAMGGGGTMYRGSRGDTVFNYINDAVVNKKLNRLTKIKQMTNSLEASDNPAQVRATIDKMINFSQRVGGLNIESPTAKFQLYQLMETQKEFQDKFNVDFQIDKKTHGVIANAFRKNQNLATLINQSMEAEMQGLINDKTPVTKDINKFEKKLDKYNELFKNVTRNEISQETLVKSLKNLESPRVKKAREENEALLKKQLEEDGISLNEDLANQAKKTKSGKTFKRYKTDDGIVVTKEVLDNIEDISEKLSKVNKDNQGEVDNFYDDLLADYGITQNEYESLMAKGVDVGKIKTSLKNNELTELKSKSTEEPKKKTDNSGSRVESLKAEILLKQADLANSEKAGTTVSPTTKQELEKLKKELRIEEIALEQSKKAKERLTGKSDEESFFIANNQEAIDKRAEELRKKPKSKEETKEKTKKEPKTETKEEEVVEEEEEAENEDVIKDRQDKVALEKELAEVNKVLKDPKTTKGRKQVFNNKTRIQNELKAIKERSLKRAKEDKLPSSIEALKEGGDLIMEDINRVDDELSNINKNYPSIFKRGKPRKELNAQKEKLKAKLEEYRNALIEAKKRKVKPKPAEQTTEVESKKADIERRRKEEIDSIISEQVFDDTGYRSTVGFKVTGWSLQEVKDEIKTKYDALLNKEGVDEDAVVEDIEKENQRILDKNKELQDKVDGFIEDRVKKFGIIHDIFNDLSERIARATERAENGIGIASYVLSDVQDYWYNKYKELQELKEFSNIEERQKKNLTIEHINDMMAELDKTIEFLEEYETAKRESKPYPTIELKKQNESDTTSEEREGRSDERNNENTRESLTEEELLAKEKEQVTRTKDDSESVIEDKSKKKKERRAKRKKLSEVEQEKLNSLNDKSDNIISERLKILGIYDVFNDLTKRISTAIARIEGGLRVDFPALETAKEYLFNKHKELLELKKPENVKERIEKNITTEHLNEMISELEKTLNHIVEYENAWKSNKDFPILDEGVITEEEGNIEDNLEEIEDEDVLTDDDEDLLNEYKSQDNTKDKSKDQRQSSKTNVVNNKNRAKANRKLFNKVLGHVQKLFPNIPIHVLREGMWHLDPSVISQVNGLGVLINLDKAFQNSALHEAGHIFVKILGKNNPIVKAGMEFIKTTPYFTEAQELYPEYSVEDQAEEALMNAVADNSLEKIKTKLDGTKAQKFVAWLKRFWNTIKKNLRIVKGQQSIDMFGDILAYSNSNYDINLGFLKKFSKDQRVYQDPITKKVIDSIQTTISNAAIQFSVANSKLNPTNNKIGKSLVYQDFVQTLISERETPGKDDIFDGLNSATVQTIIEAKTDVDAAKKLEYAMALQSPDLAILIDTAVNQLAKVDMSSVEDIEEIIKVSLKGNQSISSSVRAIITALIDNKGYLFDPAKVYKEISKIADISVDNEAFLKNLESEASNDSPIAEKLNLILNAFPANFREGIISELGSLTNLEYRSMLKDKFVNEDGEVEVSIKWKLVNRDSSINDMVNDIKQNLKRIDIENDLRPLIDSLVVSSMKDEHFNYRTKNEWFENSKQFFTILTGFKITDDQWMRYLDKKVKKSSSQEETLKFIFGMRQYHFGEQVENGNIEFKEVSGHIREFAEMMSGDLLASNFVNQSGNNVSATRLGYWVNQFNKMFTYNQEFKKTFINSEIYKDNPFIQDWNKTKEKPKWFIHDAFQNIGETDAVEHNKSEISDITLTNLFYYTQNSATTKFYSQNLGVTGDRSHATFFNARKYNAEELKNQYKKRATLDKVLLKRKFETVERAERQKAKKDSTITQDQLKKNIKIAKDNAVKLFNKLSLMTASIENGEINIKTPYEGSKKGLIQEGISELKKLLKDTDTTDTIKDSEGKAIGVKMDELLQSYILTERINRSYLEDIYAGPAIYKKTPEDVMKRMSGLNSGGKLININKPVRVFVIDASSMKRKVSDSFSFNGKSLANRISEMSGPTDVVGVNVKDMLYQIKSNGDMDYYKMSSLNVNGEVDKNSLTEFSDSNNIKGVNSYNEIGNAILKLEELLGDGTYIKVVDVDVIKGDKSQYDIITLDELINNTEAIKDRGVEKKFTNYRVAFNLNKDYSKIKLSEQAVILSTQFSKILLNYDVSIEQIKEFEDALVDVLQDTLNGKNTNNKKVIDGINNVEGVIDGITKKADENTKSSIIQLLNKITEFNSAEFEKVFTVGGQVFSEIQIGNLESLSKTEKQIAKNIITEQQFLNELKRHKLSRVQYDLLIKENTIANFNDKSLKPKNKKIRDSANNPIVTLDHPNLNALVQQFIASRLSKAGVKIDIAGIYAHMIPDYSNDLKEDEIAVPWSMFVHKQEGESDASAKERAEEMLRKDPDNEMWNIAVVRVPASSAVSGFAGKVKYFIDGKSNTAIMPQDFVERADADHDGDKVFVYRADLDEESKIIEGNKTKAFRKVFDFANSTSYKKSAREGSLDLEQIEKILKETKDKDGNPLFNEDIFKLNDFRDLSNLSSNMSFGQDAIGIWAIASKMLSVLSQSKESLKSPISFGFVNNQLIETERKQFMNTAIDDVARFLQAALDMGNNPVHISTGVNQNTIGVATTLSVLGVDFNEIIGFLKSPTIIKLVDQIQEEQSNYKDKGYVDVFKFIESKRASYDAPVAKNINNKKLEDFISQGIIESNTVYSDSIQKTKEGDTYFEIKKLNEIDGKYTYQFSMVDSNVLENQEDLNIISKFQELSAISDNLLKLIPLLQLDNKLPNNGYKTKELLELMNEINSNEMLYTTDNLSQRPLIKHYNKLLQDLSNTYSKLFLVEKEEFYDLAKSLTEKIYGKDNIEFRKKKVYDAIVESMYLNQAQKEIVKNVDVPAVFINEFTNEISTLLESIYGTKNNTNVNPSKPIGLDSSMAQQILTTLREAEEAGIEQSINYKKELLERNKNNVDIIQYVKNYENLKEIANTAYEYRDNEFLNYIYSHENNKGDITIVPKKSVSNLSEGALEIIHQDFGKLSPQLQDQFKNYAMYRFGMANKMNSLTGLLPVNIQLAYMKRNGQLFKNGVKDFFNSTDSENRIRTLEANTALLMKDSLPKLSLIEEGEKFKFLKYKKSKIAGEIIALSNSDFVNIEGKVYMRKSGETIGKGKPIVYEDLTKYGAFVDSNFKALINNYAYIGKSLKEIQDIKEKIKTEC